MYAYDMTNKIVDQLDDPQWLVKSASVADTHTTQHFEQPDINDFALALVHEGRILPKYPVKTAEDIVLSAEYLNKSDLPDDIKKIAGWFICNRAIKMNLPVPDVPRSSTVPFKHAEISHQCHGIDVDPFTPEDMARMMKPREAFLYKAELCKLGYDIEPPGMPGMDYRLKMWKYHPLAVAEIPRVMKLAEDKDYEGAVTAIEGLDDALGMPNGAKRPWEAFKRIEAKSFIPTAQMLFNHILGFLSRCVDNSDYGFISGNVREMMTPSFAIRFKANPMIAYAAADEGMKKKVRRLVYRLVVALNNVDNALHDDPKKFDEYYAREYPATSGKPGPVRDEPEDRVVTSQEEMNHMIARMRSENMEYRPRQ